jgi:hypothetical protein
MSDELSDFRDFFTNYLDRRYPNDDPSESSSYTQLRDFWTASSVTNSVGNRDAWDPLAGFSANQDRITQLYDYYRDLFNSNEPAFLWAGLGRMAGGAVLGGMRFLIQNASDPSFLTNMMVLIGKLLDPLHHRDRVARRGRTTRAAHTPPRAGDAPASRARGVVELDVVGEPLTGD